METTQELIDQKNKALFEARKIHERGENEKRGLTAEEWALVNKHIGTVTELKERIDSRTKYDAYVAEADQEAEQRTIRPGTTRKGLAQAELRAHMGNCFKHMVGGQMHLIQTEARALSVDTGTEGGYLIPAEQWLNEVIKDVDDATWVMQRARVIDLEVGRKIRAGRRTSRMTGIAWGGEKLQPVPDTGLKYGELLFEPKDAAIEILCTRSLIDMGGSMAEQEVRGEMAYAGRVGFEQEFFNGPGGIKPIGVFTAHADYIDTTRDFVGANTATVLHPDTFKRAKYQIKPDYWMNLRWAMHRSIMELVAVMKTGDSQYLLKEGLAEGDPDRIDGMPVDLSEFAPSTVEADAYVALLCDWRHYWIVRRKELQIEMLRELYAESAEYAFIGRTAIFGAPAKKEPFLRIQMNS